MGENREHYLKQELYKLLKTDGAIFDFLQEGSLDGLWYWDLEKPEQEWLSPRFWQILGYDPAEKQHLAGEWQNLIHPDDLRMAMENLKAHCADPNHPYDQMVRYRHANGSTVWVRCRGLAIRDASGKAIRMLGAHNDVTHLKTAEAKLTQQADALRQANARLARLATRDGLTNLFNRRAFDEHLEWSIANAIRTQEHLSIMLIDLDHFKEINDRLGHVEGDAALTLAAAALQSAVRGSDFPARYGGEEFALVLPRADQDASLTVAEKIRAEIARSYDKGKGTVTASVGISTLPEKTGETDIPILERRMLSEADSALYAAKQAGRNRACHFNQLFNVVPRPVPERLARRSKTH